MIHSEHEEKGNAAFSVRHEVKRGDDGHIVKDELFYLNRESHRNAEKEILHCFAFGTSFWGSDYGIRKDYGGYISLNFFTDGEVVIHSAHGEQILKKGDLLLARFRSPFTMRTKKGGFARKYCLLLSNTPIQSAICDLLEKGDPAFLHLPECERIIERMNRIAAAVKAGGDGRTLAGHILELLLEIQHQQTETPNYPEALTAALNMIENRNGMVSCRELADLCRVNLRTLTRLFRTHLHCAPGQYMIRCRLEQAARLLLLNQNSVKSISYECGFSSPMFFARQFRKYYQCTPTEYRSQRFIHP